MLKTRTKAFFWITATFLIGFLLGGGASYLMFGEWAQTGEARSSSRPWERKDREPHPSLEEFVKRLNKDANLNLSAEQRTQVMEIIRKTREKYDLIAQESRERFSEARSRSRDQIREVLDAQQMENFDEFLKNRKKRHSKKSE